MSIKQHILVVDDDLSIRKTLFDILRVKGYEVIPASNGQEAIAAVKKAEISLALIDLKLPDMSGLDVMARIKAIRPLAETIILTGNASMNTAIEATRQGAFCYLLKPYNMDDLLLNINHGVERRQAREKIIRLASFPRLNPNPVIEIDEMGELSYLNPAAERVFPELASQGKNHTLLNSSVELFAALRQSKQQEVSINECAIGNATYELHISYIQDAKVIRIYVMDITQRKNDEEAIYLLATTDSLTGIMNRRQFTSVLERQIDQTKRYGMPFGLAMYDLDNFKRVNDTFGHDIGDYALQAVTRVVKENIRNTDVVARWGGEEFMLMMPQTDIRTAYNVAEKLRQVIADHYFDKVNGLTVSFGVTAFELQDDQNSLFKRADDALYLAKKHGRNRVEALNSQNDISL